ncbi:MAG: hypothetical protein VYA55_05085 [Pseudomonadota bacterium]|nr:hypothetical protein [Pseudomonadota bacterium]
MRKLLFLGLSMLLFGCKPVIETEISSEYLGSGETFGLCAHSSVPVTITLHGAAVSGAAFDDGACQWLVVPETSAENVPLEYEAVATNAFGTTRMIIPVQVNVPVTTALGEVEAVSVSVRPEQSRYVHEVTTLRVEQVVRPPTAPAPDLSFIKRFHNLGSLFILHANIASLDGFLLSPPDARFAPLPQLKTLSLQNTPSLTHLDALSGRVLSILSLGAVPVSTLPPLQLEFSTNADAGLAIYNMTLADWNFMNQMTVYRRNPGADQNRSMRLSLRHTEVADWSSITDIDGVAFKLRGADSADWPLHFADYSTEPYVPCLAVDGLNALFDSVTLDQGCLDEVDPGFTVSEVPFADPAFRACFSDPDQLVEDVESVSCSAGEIASLSGIEFFDNLKFIRIQTPVNDIVDLEPLRGLNNLMLLAMWGTSRELVDVSALLDLPNLFEVVVSDSPKLDCSVVDQLVAQSPDAWIDFLSCESR